MKAAILVLAGMAVTAPASAEPAGSVWLPTLGISMPNALPSALPPPVQPMTPGRPPVSDVPPPPVLDRPVAQPGLLTAAPGAPDRTGDDPVEQQKRALYQTELQAHQRDLANRTGLPAPVTSFDALTTQQELNRLRLQAPN